MTTEELLEDLAADGFGHWFAGFIDGEGSFLIKEWGYRPTGRTGYVCRVQINLRADDRAILDECVRRTGMGRIHANLRTTSRSKAQVCWTVNRRDDCVALAQILDRFPLRAKKARDYAIWREAVNEWVSVPRPRGNRKHCSDWTRMAELKERLVAARVFIET